MISGCHDIMVTIYSVSSAICDEPVRLLTGTRVTHVTQEIEQWLAVVTPTLKITCRCFQSVPNSTVNLETC